MKKSGILFLTFIFMLLIALPVNAAGESIQISLGFKNEERSQLSYIFKSYQPLSDEGELYIMLPDFVKGQNVQVDIDGTGKLIIDDVEISDDDVISAPPAGKYEIITDEIKRNVNVVYGSHIPSVLVTTQSGTLREVYADKSHKEPGHIIITDGNTDTVYNGEMDYIKGRGNSTWTDYPKKPFNIKLSEKTDLFGMGKNKSWSLLANYKDVTGLRNKVALDYANSVGIDFTSSSIVVDLYVNGEYMGMYTLVEKVEIDDDRVEIVNLAEKNEDANPDIDIEECARNGENQKVSGTYKYFEIPVNPENITGGYLLEYEMVNRYPDEVSGFVSNYGQAVVIKEPEIASKEQVEYISSYYQQFEDALRSDSGTNRQGKHYSEYIDTESFIKGLLLNEFTKNLDAAMSSFYICKDENDVMTAGPAWDFDMALGTVFERDGIMLEDPSGIYASDRLRLYEDDYTVLGLMSAREEIRNLAVEQWNLCFSPAVSQMIDRIDSNAKTIRSSAIVNIVEWSSEPVSCDQAAHIFDTEIQRLKQFIIDRAEFMDGAFSSDSTYVIYNDNGADGETLDAAYYSPGQTAAIMESAFEAEVEFYSWNTKPDGCGASYMPGETVEMDETLVLYAQWGKPGFKARVCSFINSLFK